MHRAGLAGAGAIGALACAACALLLAEPSGEEPFGSRGAAPSHALPSAPRVSFDWERAELEAAPQRVASAVRAGAEGEAEALAAQQSSAASLIRSGRSSGSRALSAANASARPAARPAAQVAAGQVRVTVEGRIQDEQGFPLVDAQVASLDPPAKARTNAQGEFTLELRRAPGAGLVIEASADGHVPVQRVVVAQTPRVELALALTARTAGAALTVSLLSGYGERVASERVFVTPVGSANTYSSPTGDDGVARLSDFQPGPVLVWLDGNQLQRRVELRPGENHLDLRLP